MSKRTCIILMAGLLLASMCTAVMGNNSSGSVPEGTGEKINFFSTEFIATDDPCWLRISSVEMFYPRAIPDLKEYFETQTVVRAQAYVEIYINGLRLSSDMIDHYMTWVPVDPDMFPGMPVPPEDADARYKTWLIQFPGGYFLPGQYLVTILAGWKSQNALAVLLGWDNPTIIESTLHVSD